MSRPPATPPSSDVDGVNRDARAGTPKKEADRDDAEWLEKSNDLAKAKPKSDSGSGASGG